MFMVKARKNGFYGGIYRYAKDKFSISSEKDLSMHWMERLTKDEVKEAEDKVKALKKVDDDAIALRKKDSEDRAEARAADRASIKQRNAEVGEIKAKKAQERSVKN